jgi:hypothetical protein
MRKVVLGIVAALSIVLASASDVSAQPLRARLAARAALNGWGDYAYPGYYSSGYYYPSYYSSGYYYPSYSGYYNSGYYMPGYYNSGFYNSGYYYPNYYNSGYYGGWYPGSTALDIFAPRVSNFIRGGWGY